MLRAATAPSAPRYSAAVLLTFCLLAVSASFAHAYAGHLRAGGVQAGITPSATAPAAESPASHAGPFCGDPTGPPPHRDRHRTAGSTPGTGGRPLPPYGPEPDAGLDAPAPSIVRDHASRPSRSHTPAALQVFRC
ncbi:hypothetical protein OQI_15175 [Streptomyces pharetrae CZA14]|uniref:Uncharacterized protein n=1 Tax=Streptomyces pharetrae CZA14 TaxID=1144883 RepID=A0ABX3YIF9_9ACTN|nr:hypothetical protein OQI_15175 [Streptomyces pharetrae CZA14]